MRLPEDNAYALTIVCTVLRLRKNAVLDSPTPNEVLQVAVTEDKYNYTGALKFASDRWLKPRGNEKYKKIQN